MQCRAWFQYVEAPVQSLCGGPQYLEEVFFKVKEILYHYQLAVEMTIPYLLDF